MDGKNEKSQPQELLEEVIGITHENKPEPEFPTFEEQQEYWRQKDEEEAAAAQPDPTPFTCPTCLKQFKSAQAVRMHVARVHTKTILTAGQQGKLKPKPDLVQHPLYDYPPTVKQLADEPRVAWSDKVPPKRKWSPKRRRAYNRMKKAAMEQLMAPVTAAVEELGAEEPVAMIRFCPHCGKGLERFLA